MELSRVEKDDIAAIVDTIYNSDLLSPRASNITENTVLELETILEALAECDRHIKTLLSSLQCARLGKGWLMRCIKGVANVVRTNSKSFRARGNSGLGCRSTVANSYRMNLRVQFKRGILN